MILDFTNGGKIFSAHFLGELEQLPGLDKAHHQLRKWVPDPHGPQWAQKVSLRSSQTLFFHLLPTPPHASAKPRLDEIINVSDL